MNTPRIQLNQRERFLLTAILGIAVLWWGGGVLSAWVEALREASRIRTQDDQAQLDLAFDPEIRDRLGTALAQLETKRFLSANRFIEIVDRIARDADVLPNLGRVNTRENEGVRLHRLDLEIRSLKIAELIRLESLLREQSPYIQIESIFVNSRRNTAVLSAEFVLSAFEVDVSASNP